MTIDIGGAIPAFSLTDEAGNPVALGDFSGSRLIMFFYPKAMTPGCTTEACDFRDNYGAFLDAGFAVVGVSPDSPAANAKFKEKEGLTFPLLSDEDHSLAARLGAWGLKTNYGKEYEGLIRSTFVVGPGGALEAAYRNVRAKGHVARLVRELVEASA
jgi:peroxiredoxin Q/BCP